MSASVATSSAAREAELADLIDRVTAQVKAGETPDADAIVRDYPQFADELRELLSAVQVMADLSHSLAAGPSSADGEALRELGDFRIVREAGRGGMGVVYEAEQMSLGRRVALKVLPFAATMDPRALVRFRNEAKAAASLRHENIVHVYGVGCDRGVHYYAMEFVDGQTLAEVIADRRRPASSGSNRPHTPWGSAGAAGAEGAEGATGDATGDYVPAAPTAPVAVLSTQEPHGNRAYCRRVAELIAQAADALEHAHGLGIVHRDVKPGNLLCDAAGKIYVGDFGLARVGPDAGVTVSGDLLGTLRYMAPEQAMARHGLADHRVDVYGLGATLYELLTGRPAVGGTDKADILRHIAFEEPAPPRKLDKSIPAELETVTLKALAKNPAERYATAGEFADDLRRWLGNQTIRARRPSLRQRLDKWARRHATAVVAAAVALLIGMAVSTWQAVVARNARGRAADEAAIAEAISEFFQCDVLMQADAAEQLARGGKPDPGLTVKQALDRAAARVAERFRGRPKIEGAIRNTIGAAYVTVGDHRQAIAHLERAVALAQAEYGPGARPTLVATCNLAHAYKANARPQDAIDVLTPAIERATASLGRDHHDCVNASNILGQALTRAERGAEAIPLHERACAWAKTWADPRAGEFAAVAQVDLAHAYVQAKRPADAVAALRRLLDAQTAELGPRHLLTCRTMSALGWALLAVRQPAEARAMYEKAFDGLRAALGPDHPDTLDAMVTLAMDSTFDDPAAGLPQLEEVVARMKAKLGPDHPQTHQTMDALGKTYLRLNRPADAATVFAELLARERALHGPTDANTLGSISQLGDALARAGRWGEAADFHREWVEVFRATLGLEHKETLQAIVNLTVAARNAGRPMDAGLLEQALDALRRRPPADAREFATSVTRLAEAFDAAGLWEKGIPLAQEAVTRQEQLDGPDHADTLAALRRLCGLYRRAGRWADEKAQLTELVKRTTARLGPDHADTFAARRDLALAAVNEGQPAEAVAELEPLRDAEAARHGVGTAPMRPTLNALTTAYHFAGRFDDADRTAREFLALHKKHSGPESLATANALALLGMNLLAQARYADAEPALREASRLYEKHAQPAWQRGRMTNMLGAAVAGVGRPDEAEPLLVGGYEAMKREEAAIPGPWRRHLADAGRRVARFYDATKRPDKAREWREKLPPDAPGGPVP